MSTISEPTDPPVASRREAHTTARPTGSTSASSSPSFLITALEVSTYFWDVVVRRRRRTRRRSSVLLVLMVVKFVMIASYFMHLKFDRPLLERIFYFGLGTRDHRLRDRPAR